MKHIPRGITMAALALALFACAFPEAESGAGRLTVVGWNVQNLFDGSDNGFEYAEFKSSEGWNNEKYRARLNSIVPALKGLDGSGADILCLIEVENASVIEDIASGLDYRWTFFAGAPEGSVGIGILSKLPLAETKAHSFHSPQGELPRPVAEVRVETASGPLTLLACHWKSKLGGAEATEQIRRAAAALVARRVTEIEAASPGMPVIVLGDLNENYDEFTRSGAAYPCALLPDTNGAAELVYQNAAALGTAFQDFLVLSGQKPPRAVSYKTGTIALYSPWLEGETSADTGTASGGIPLAKSFAVNGSYYYQDDWETIDHFLLNGALFDKTGWDYARFFVPAEDPFVTSGGIPKAYNPRTGNGLSDHLPITLCLELAPEP